MDRMTYLGNGHFCFPDRTERECKYLGMVVQGHDLTKVFQVVESIATSKDSTFLSLLYVVPSLEDAALLEELAFFKELDKVHINVLAHSDTDFQTMTGSLEAQHIADFMPPPGPRTLVLLVGDAQFRETAETPLKSQGYTQDMYYML